MNNVLKPMKVGPRTAVNRIVINAMEASDALPNGDPSELTYKRYENYFKGGAGIVILEAITPQYEHIARANQLSIKEHNLPALKKFVAHLKELNPDTLIFFQITHSGEISSNRCSTRIRVTEEPLPGYEDAELVREEVIDQVIQDYIDGAVRAYEVGADGVDLKLCHGYLGCQILRPYNKDDWKYGGKWENRRQFAVNIYDGVRKAIPDENFIIGSKISVYEGIPGGVGTMGPDSACMELSETIDLLKTLEKHGMQYMIQSAGSPSHTLDLAHPDIRTPDYAYMHFYFQKVCREALSPEIPVIGSACSIFRDGRKEFYAVKPEKNSFAFWANKNIGDGIVDAYAIGRQAFADPYLPVKMKEGREKDIKWCTLCDHCVELLIRQDYNVGCCTYDRHYAALYKDANAKRGVIKEKHT